MIMRRLTDLGSRGSTAESRPEARHRDERRAGRQGQPHEQQSRAPKSRQQHREARKSRQQQREAPASQQQERPHSGYGQELRYFQQAEHERRLQVQQQHDDAATKLRTLADEADEELGKIMIDAFSNLTGTSCDFAGSFMFLPWTNPLNQQVSESASAGCLQGSTIM